MYANQVKSIKGFIKLEREGTDYTNIWVVVHCDGIRDDVLQEQRAYRLQQEERVLRAEHQAMKMRYETRLEKLSVEYR